jgi:hypothetical protein
MGNIAGRGGAPRSVTQVSERSEATQVPNGASERLLPLSLISRHLVAKGKGEHDASPSPLRMPAITQASNREASTTRAFPIASAYYHSRLFLATL